MRLAACCNHVTHAYKALKGHNLGLINAFEFLTCVYLMLYLLHRYVHLQLFILTFENTIINPVVYSVYSATLMKF